MFFSRFFACRVRKKSDGPPGWLTLWRGWMPLQSMLLGAQALETARCGET
jgi:hypothetical protein